MLSPTKICLCGYEMKESSVIERKDKKHLVREATLICSNCGRQEKEILRKELIKGGKDAQ